MLHLIFIYMLARNEYWDGLSFSCSSSTPDSNLTRGLKDNGIFGEVLTLAPPSTSSAWMNPKSVEPPPTLPSDNKNNFLDHKPLRLYQVRQFLHCNSF